MARSISWQRDLSRIHRQVSESSRSPYRREDIEQVFGVEERAARKLMELMPRSAMGNIHVIEREGLLEFLAGALDTQDLRGYLDTLRKEPPRVQRRRLKLKLPASFEPGNMRSLERWNVWLERGKVTIAFDSMEELMARIYQLLMSVEDPAFERRYCASPAQPLLTPEQAEQQADMERVRRMTDVLRKLGATKEAFERGEYFRSVGESTEAAVFDQAAEMLRSQAALAIDGAQELCGAEWATEQREKLASLCPPPSSSGTHNSSQGWMPPPVAVPAPGRAPSDRAAL